MIQHIALVLEATGLCAREKAVLVAICNHTDASGKTFAGQDRLMREAGMPVATFKRWRAKLVERNLLSSKRKYRKGGGRATSDTWVNLRALRDMHDPFFSSGDSSRTDDENPFDTQAKGPTSEPFKGPTSEPTVGSPMSPLTLNNPQVQPSDRCGCCSTSTTDACACVSTDADALQQSKQKRLADAIEREMAAQRAKVKATEEAGEPPLPVAWPPVRHDPKLGWIRTDGETKPQEPAADEKKTQKKPSKYAPLSDNYMPPEALVRKMNQLYPGIDVRFEVSQFVGYYSTRPDRRSNWHHVFETWCERSAKQARERAARSSFQSSTQLQSHVARPSTTDQRVAAAMDLAARLSAQEAAQ